VASKEARLCSSSQPAKDKYRLLHLARNAHTCQIFLPVVFVKLENKLCVVSA